MADARVPAKSRAKRAPRLGTSTNSFGPTRGPGRRAPGPEAGGQARASAGPAGAGLGNVVGTSSAEGQKRRATEEFEGPDSADVRWAVHRVMWKASPLKKVRFCRRYPHDKDSATLPLKGSAREGGGLSVGFGGLRVCASWHSCMTCGPKIAVHRARELSHMFRVWEALGGSVIMATFSARHHRGQRLEDLVTGMRSGWSAIKSGRPWRNDAATLGISWVIRAFEVTVGDEHGWHPHYHTFLLVDGPVSEDFAREACGPMWDRWQEGLAEVGMTAVATVTRGGVQESAGFDVKVMDDSSHETEDMGRYPFKMALEAVGGVFKRGRGYDAEGRTRGHRHRTPFEVMEHYAVAESEGHDKYADQDRDIVHEWSETATKMRFRQCPITKKMRDFFTKKAAELDIPGPLLDEELQEQEIAEAEVAGSETLAHVSSAVYTSTIVYELDTMKAAARRGFRELVAWFDERRIAIELTEAGEALLAEADWFTTPPERTFGKAPGR